MAKKYALSLLGKCFHTWRSVDYVQKGKGARVDYGRIPDDI
jgi:hypothetical protein